MKLSHLTVRNTIGLRHLDVELDTPLTLFAGPNGAGKTSVAQALRLALVAEPSRVTLKKDYDKLVTEGAHDAEILVRADGEEYAVAISGAGKVTDNQAGRETPAALPFVLDMHRFSSLTADERRAFLFGLAHIEITGDAVMARLKERGCVMAMAEEVKPVLRSGFPAAAEYAKKKATEGKGAWKATAGGETWGKDKGGRWRAAKPDVRAADLDGMSAGVTRLDAEIEQATIDLGELQGRARQVAEQAGKLADLREKAGRYARIQEKLHRDEADLKAWAQKVEEMQAKATGAPPPAEPILACPHCAGLLLHVRGELQAYEKPDLTPDAEAAAKLPEYKDALRLMQSAVANGLRDLHIADAAAKALAELETPDTTAADITTEDVDGKKATINELKAARKATADKLEAIRAEVRKAEAADEATRKSGVIHKAILDWLTVAEALEPSGIPGELLAEALRPINDRLRHAAEITGWMQATIAADMDITADSRPYALLSESEQWRVDAMLAEAIAHLSRLRLLVLDRLDVLDLPGRSAALLWLHELALAGEIETAVVLATLKALPASLPATYRCHWLDGGRIVVQQQMKAAA